MIWIFAADLFHRIGTELILKELQLPYRLFDTSGIFPEIPADENPQLALMFLDQAEPEPVLEHFIQLFPRLPLILIFEKNPAYSRLQHYKSLAAGLLTRHCNNAEIKMAIHKVLDGQGFVCSRLTQILPDHSAPLSDRETEVLKLIASGKKSREIADLLFLSPHTVHTHRKNIFRKLSISSSSDATRFASELGLI